MKPIEGIALWLAIAGYVLGFAAGAAVWFFQKTWIARAASALPYMGFGGHTASLLVRWIASGHAPVMGVYENSLAGAWFLPVIFWAVTRSFPGVRRAAPVVLAAVLLLVGNGLMGSAESAALEPPYRSNWLAVHVTFAWLAFGAYVVASGLAGYYLWVTRASAAVPQPDRRGAIDETATKLIAFGFVCDSVMIASGAIWAHGLWGRYWAWDPIETWSLISWLFYGVNLHLRFTLGWHGRRAAWIAVVSVAGIIITFFGLGIVSAMHTQLL